MGLQLISFCRQRDIHQVLIVKEGGKYRNEVRLVVVPP